MRNSVAAALAAALVAVACDGQQKSAPAAASAPPAGAPNAAPAQELPSPDSANAAVNPPGTAPAAGQASTDQQPPAARPGVRGAPPSGERSTTGGAQPPPGAPAPPQPTPASPPAASSPETPPEQDQGASVLQRASAAYRNVRSLQAEFVMHYNNPLLRQQTTSRGMLYQRRPDRIALRFSDPAGDVILSDGAFYWIYYPSVDAKQVIRCSVGEGGEQGVDLQAQFVGDPVRRFRYTLHGQESVGGRTAHVLTLEPRERTDYRALKVWLDARDSLARRFEITEHNGTVRRFELSDFHVNATIPDATFRFSPPAGARIVSCG